MWYGDQPECVAEPLLAIETSSLARTMLHGLTADHGSRSISHLATQNEAETRAGGVLIDARGRHVSPQAKRLQHGSRSMRTWRNLLLKGAPALFGEIYAGKGFWTFAFPTGANSISLQIATPRRYSISELGDVVRGGFSDRPPLLSSALSATPDLFDCESDEVSTAPSLLLEDPSSSYLPIGDALMTLDPLCGDGTGHGIKSALLAVGLLNSVGVDVPEARALSHYVARAHFAYKTHLEHCRRYYLSMRDPTCWVDEVENALPAALDGNPTHDGSSRFKLVVAGIGEGNVKPSIKLIPDHRP